MSMYKVLHALTRALCMLLTTARPAAMQVAVLLASGACCPCLVGDSLWLEQLVFLSRERAAGYYSTYPFALGQALVEVPLAPG